MENYVQTCLKEDNYHSFKTECNCFVHDLKVHFEKTEDEINLTFYDENYGICDGDFESSLFSRFITRIKLAYKILFTGYVEIETHFSFKNEKHVDEFMRYMNETYSEIKKDKEI